MIIESFYEDEWKITILYEITCEDIDYVIRTLKDIDCPNKYIKEAIDNIGSCNLNSGLTYSNFKLKSSVIIIGKTSSFEQLINTISHEYFHLICHISKGLNIKSEEELAQLNGDLNMHSYKVIRKLEKKLA